LTKPRESWFDHVRVQLVPNEMRDDRLALLASANNGHREFNGS
jgi:hypothetical protein